MSWSRAFDEPIQPAKGKKLVTLKDAAAHILALPKSEQQSPEWQAAIEAVIMAAEDRGPLMHAHFGMMLALHGAEPIPEYDSSKRKALGTAKAEEGRNEGCVRLRQVWSRCFNTACRCVEFSRKCSGDWAANVCCTTNVE